MKHNSGLKTTKNGKSAFGIEIAHLYLYICIYTLYSIILYTIFN